jgi:hypothetical protein
LVRFLENLQRKRQEDEAAFTGSADGVRAPAETRKGTCATSSD